MTLTAAALALASAMAAGARADCGRIWQAPKRASDHELRASVLCLVNRARTNRGIAPLAFSAELRRSATGHSRSMVRQGVLSHFGPRGSTPETRIGHSGYLARAVAYRVAENIAAGSGRRFGSPRAIVSSWMRSPGHRANILDRMLRDFGVGVARGEPGWRGGGNAATYTLDLGRRGGG